MEWTVRPYEKADWSAIEAIHDAARKIELSLAGLPDAFVPLKEAAVREGLFDYAVVVAEQDGQVLGFAAYSAEELAWLYVDPAHMRRGIGMALGTYVLEENKGAMAVEVLCGNEPAKGLYEKLGFRTREIASGRMPGNESFRVQVCCMERR